MAAAGLRHPDLAQSTGQISVLFIILRANTALSECWSTFKDHSRVEKLILRGTCERASMNRPGAQWVLMWRLVTRYSPLLSQAREKEKDLNCTQVISMESKNGLIMEHQSGLSRIVFPSNWTYSGMRGSLVPGPIGNSLEAGSCTVCCDSSLSLP